MQKCFTIFKKLILTELCKFWAETKIPRDFTFRLMRLALQGLQAGIYITICPFSFGSIDFNIAPSILVGAGITAVVWVQSTHWFSRWEKVTGDYFCLWNWHIEYWAFHLFTCSFTHTSHSFACSHCLLWLYALLHLFARSLACSLTRSRTYGKEVLIHVTNVLISYSFNPWG